MEFWKTTRYTTYILILWIILYSWMILYKIYKSPYPAANTTVTEREEASFFNLEEREKNIIQELKSIETLEELPELTTTEVWQESVFEEIERSDYRY